MAVLEVRTPVLVIVHDTNIPQCCGTQMMIILWNFQRFGRLTASLHSSSLSNQFLRFLAEITRKQTGIIDLAPEIRVGGSLDRIDVFRIRVVPK